MRHLYALAFVACCSALALALALIWRAEHTYRYQQLAKDNCAQIEALKTQVREEAIEDYANLDRTLRLLKIARTPEIERVAQEQRDKKLNRFRAKPCL